MTARDFLCKARLTRIRSAENDETLLREFVATLRSRAKDLRQASDDLDDIIRASQGLAQSCAASWRWLEHASTGTSQNLIG